MHTYTPRDGRFPAAPRAVDIRLGGGAASWMMHDVLFMITEHFESGDPGPVYERFREQGRLAPEGLDYVASWVTSDLTRCYQVMECADRALLDQWIAQWADLVRFDVVEVMTSAAAAAAVAQRT